MRSAEFDRLAEDRARRKNWKRWGPYLSERQWGTVREDYSSSGDAWSYLPHDHARSRAYRWGEDGLLGVCDREGRLCFAIALWNERDPILKERLFGLNGHEGNHAEDIKEVHFHLDATPTHSYLKALYKYPQSEFPYNWLVEENRRRTKRDPEFELLDTGIFQDSRYFDVVVEYAKCGPDDILIRIRVENRGPDEAPLHILPTVWFRNTWSWGRSGEGYWPKGCIQVIGSAQLAIQHASLGRMYFAVEEAAPFLFTENETNMERLFGFPSASPHVKDAFHERLIRGREEAVCPDARGTKAAAWYRKTIPAGGSIELRCRLWHESERVEEPFRDFDAIFEKRISEADEFYKETVRNALTPEIGRLIRSAYTGLLWSKQFFHYAVSDWLDGDSAQPTPPGSRLGGRNSDWRHLFNRDVISMPDAWEYPWYAAWDLAFHMIPFARIDPDFAKEQLILMLREWYMHPNGQMPAYEFAFSDVNPPVHAWACWRTYKICNHAQGRDRVFLTRAFQKLLLNFTWWVNRKDVAGKQVFSGGFLGLDNIGLFDRSQPLPDGGILEQADGTAWMAFYCSTMFSMAIELAPGHPAYEDMASKFFEHFVAIADAMNTLGGHGLWDEADGFYYDQVQMHGKLFPMKIRSMVGIIPLFAVELLEENKLEQLPAFRKRMEWFLANRRDLSGQISWMAEMNDGEHRHRLLAIPSRERLARVLRRVFDEDEFLSPYGIRSLSKAHSREPFEIRMNGDLWRVQYEPGESQTGMFGGNSNWRGPVWFPVNYLLIEALERYGHFYGDTFKVEFPTRSNNWLTLTEAAHELNARLCCLFIPDANGNIPWHGDMKIFSEDPAWKELTWFYEYFHAETGRGCGANHQTGWTALLARCLEDLTRDRS